MGLTDPPAIRHSAVGIARRYDADKLIRHLRAGRMPDEVRTLPAAVAEV